MSDNSPLQQGLDPAQIFNLKQAIQVNPDAIVSKTLRKSAHANLTLFAFDQGQSLAAHSSPMDAYVQILSGKMTVTIGTEQFILTDGQMILMPAQVDHALEALSASSLLLIMVSTYDGALL